MAQFCPKSIKPHTGYPIDRKAIDISGRLGSLYDASHDRLIDNYSVETFQTKLPPRRSICKILSGSQLNDEIFCLEQMDFDDALRQSILLRIIAPSGISSLVDYNQPIDQNTRFLYYSYRSRREKLRVKARKANKIVGVPSSSTPATHMITKILYGIEILCVIQIPRSQSVAAVDRVLHNIRNLLENRDRLFDLTDAERRQIAQLTNITVFGSETCIVNPRTSMLTILGSIEDWQTNRALHHPLIYTMQPLRWLFNNEAFQEPCDLPNPTNFRVDRVQPALVRLENWMKDLQQLIDNLPEQFSSPSLNQKLKNARDQFHVRLDTYEDLRQHLRMVLVEVRRERLRPTEIDNVMSEERYLCLRTTELESFRTNIKRLSAKAQLIKRLDRDGIRYINVSDINTYGSTLRSIESIDVALKLICSNEHRSVVMWYSSDRLKREQAERMQQIYQQLLAERQQTSEGISLIYADFSDCLQKLDEFWIVRLPITSSPRPPPINSRDPPPPPPPFSVSRPPSSVTEVNILLLGETGVGKSTFINAFVNYLMFESLQEAERSEPIVLIPVSFLITINDQFDEFIVKYGDVDPNENHSHEGQSVTQQCKSYVFDINDRLRLRLIDTPGMGDTRGVAQDVKNIDHILTYLNNLSHLNAVCLLLKPNASRLNVFFRSCITQLFTYLTPIGYNNIIFCFTNSRATFFAPGNTGPLLRKMLEQNSADIPFGKANTFCFDSESFRYLAARKRDINFDEFQKQECIKSWMMSVTESVRLLDFIDSLQPYLLHEWQSPRKAALEIVMLARPLMEALRLLIFNWKLSESGAIGDRMKLNLSPVISELCSNCAPSNIVQVGPIWVIQYHSALSNNNAARHHLCPLNDKHFLIEYAVTHQYISDGFHASNEKWHDSFSNLLFKCDRLLHFLRQQGPSAQDDPFLPVLERFLDEEQKIHDTPNIDSNLNRKVHEVLRSLRQTRQQNSQRLFGSNEKLSLVTVYNIIEELTAIPVVNEQIESIRKSRQRRMEEHECRVATNTIKNRTFAVFANSLR